MQTESNPVPLRAIAKTTLQGRTLILLCFATALLALAAVVYFAGEEEVAYSFIVAGHTYGKPKAANIGLHPPFKDDFDYIKQLEKVAFGVFTGDIVRASTVAAWDAVDEDIESLGLRIYFAPGNHDRPGNELYLNRYGVDRRSYYSFTYYRDLFIVLDPNTDGWSITGEQLHFLTRTLERADHYENVFVFLHQLIWWDDRDEFRNLRPNSTKGRGQSVNFWPSIMPLFRQLPNQVYFFAGDSGAFANRLPSYFQYANTGLIASGMGGGVNDGYLIVSRRAGSGGPVEIALKLLATDTPEILPRTRLETKPL